MDTENKENNSSAPSQEPVKEITKEAVIAELTSEDRYLDYFKDFHAASVKHFIDSYAFYKELWCKWGESNIQQNDMEDMRWINAAQHHLEIIQQQKLFNAQCLWRAEKVSFAEVEICFDFMVWGKNVLHCPFIEPINEDDINLYIQYLGQDEFDFEARGVWEWQDYKRLKESYENEDADYDFPDWYNFSMGRSEIAVLMALPNIREEKEDRYRTLNYEPNREQHEELIKKSEAARDKRPQLDYYNKEQLAFFVNTFEDKQIKEYYTAYERSRRNRYEEEEMERIVNLLLSADEPVPVEPNDDLKEALRKACQRYNAKKIAEFLPYAFDEYKLNRSMGFGPSEEALKRTKTYGDIRERIYKRIINGRILNGEPGDLNF